MRSETESEALARVEDDSTAWTSVPDSGDLQEVRRLVEQRDETQVHLDGAVIRARRNGLTWLAIAEALGVSHQAAHKRYADRTRP